ncbi:hypothetical protein AURDEDRAFT_172275 [Auricularia subglabra TFB-10046 SS5]|nr:hypothetical protein AURDEDRAFT_172275 [Auricularia subglabra TFB-10046 SS5]
MREFRLCAPDTLHPVPQERFSQPLLYTLPPLHLMLKHEKRLQYVLKAWVALRDFWLRRIQRDGFCGLPAATWRKVLDDKYHVDPKLASWIEEHNSEPRVHTTGRATEGPAIGASMVSEARAKFSAHRPA